MSQHRSEFVPRTEVQAEFRHVHESLERIEKAVIDGDTTVMEQALKTNARVTKLEEWRTFLNGAIASIATIFGVAIGFAGLAGAIVALAK